MNQSNSNQNSKKRKARNKNKKNKNKSQPNENKTKLSNNENQESNLNKCNYQSASSPRPTNISKNNELFETKRSSGSEFEEFHTPSCEYPDLNNVELSKEKDFDNEWMDIGSFKAPSLEGIPEISNSHSLISNDFSNLNGGQNLPDSEWHPVSSKRPKSKTNKISNGFVPKENSCSWSKLETEEKQKTVTKIQMEKSYIIETKNPIEIESVVEYFHDCLTEHNDFSIETKSISNDDDCNDFKSIIPHENNETTETVCLEVSLCNDNETEHLLTSAVEESSEISQNIFIDEMEVTELRNDNDNVSNNKDNDNVSNNKDNDNVSNNKDSVNVSNNKDNVNVSNNKDNDNVSDDKDNDNVSDDKDNDNVSDDKDNDNVSDDKDNVNVSNNKDNDNVSNDKDNDNVSNNNDNSNNNFDENIDNCIIGDVKFLNSDNEFYGDHINDIEQIKDNDTDESENGMSTIKSLLELESENIHCTDENLDSEVLPFSKVKVEINYKINIIKKSMTYTARDLNDSHRQSATTITNVTSISDENINLNYQNDLKKPKINKKGKKIFSNIFSKFKKRKLIIKPENIENSPDKVENNLPIEQMDFYDEASIECNSKTKGLEIDSNKALKSYDDSINNFGEVKPTTDDEGTESDNVFLSDNLNSVKVKETNQEKLSENNSIEDLSNENQISPGKIALRNDIESLDNSFKFLKDFEKDSIKTDNEELIITEENIIDDLKCEIAIIKQEKQPEKLEIKIKSLEDVREKTVENVSLDLQHQLSLNANSKKKRKRKFATFFIKKKKNELNRTKSVSRENIENSNDDKDYLKCDRNNQIELECKPIEEFNKIVNDLQNRSINENGKVICKNKNDYPSNTTEECLINKEMSFINDDHLFPDAITPSKIIHFNENNLYNFPFIDDPIIIAHDSKTMFKGENKKMIILTEFIAPFGSLETLSKLEKHAPFASSESLHSQENPGKISEISKSPLRINKRPLNSLMGIFSRTR